MTLTSVKSFGLTTLTALNVFLMGSWASAQSPSVNVPPNNPTVDYQPQNSGGSGPNHGPYVRLAPASQSHLTGSEHDRLFKAADTAFQQGRWREAEGVYQHILTLDPKNKEALYGLGACRQAAGDFVGGAQYYHTAIYLQSPPNKPLQINESRPLRLMEYVVLLSQAGQPEQALTMYRYAAHLLNYEDGGQHLKILLPNFDSGPKDVVPQDIQAMARIGIAIDWQSSDPKMELSDLQQAVHLAPKSAVAYYYLGTFLSSHGSKADARAALEKAKALGGDLFSPEVDEAIELTY